MNLKGLTDNFQRVGNTPEAWESASRDLLMAAQIVKERHDAIDPVELGAFIKPIEMMLRGFALENLMKALWVKQGKAIVNGGKYIGVPHAGNHKLAPLAEVVGLTVDLKRRDVLERLTLFVTFVGRYPIPTRAEHGCGVGWSTPQDDETLNDMVHELKAKLA